MFEECLEVDFKSYFHGHAISSVETENIPTMPDYYRGRAGLATDLEEADLRVPGKMPMLIISSVDCIRIT